MEPLHILILYFAICSFLGYIIWHVFISLSIVPEKKKFLYGPFYIIDGFSVLLVYFYNFLNFPLAIKIVSYFFILVALEYFISIIYEKFHRPKLKNSSKRKSNLIRINFKIVLLWFALILLVVFIGQPFLFGILHKLPLNIAKIFSILFLFYLTIDIAFSVKKRLKNKRFNS